MVLDPDLDGLILRSVDTPENVKSCRKMKMMVRVDTHLTGTGEITSR